MVGWRDIFKKYLALVGEYEGASFLYERDWTPEEWAVIQDLRLEMEQDTLG